MDEPITAAMTQQQEVADKPRQHVSDAAWATDFYIGDRADAEAFNARKGLMVVTTAEWEARARVADANMTGGLEGHYAQLVDKYDRVVDNLVEAREQSEMKDAELAQLRAEAVKARERIAFLEYALKAAYHQRNAAMELQEMLGAELERLRKGVMPNVLGTPPGQDAVTGAAHRQNAGAALLIQPATDPRLGRGRGAME